ncbi:MAG: hypothetical protein ACP5I3_11515 [Thermoproteus sp.]
MVKVVEAASAGLLGFLGRYYEVELEEDAARLLPLSPESHAAAAARLEEALRDAFAEAAARSGLTWSAYVKALAEALERRLAQ